MYLQGSEKQSFQEIRNDYFSQNPLAAVLLESNMLVNLSELNKNGMKMSNSNSSEKNTKSSELTWHSQFSDLDKESQGVKSKSKFEDNIVENYDDRILTTAETIINDALPKNDIVKCQNDNDYNNSNKATINSFKPQNTINNSVNIIKKDSQKFCGDVKNLSSGENMKLSNNNDEESPILNEDTDINVKYTKLKNAKPSENAFNVGAEFVSQQETFYKNDSEIYFYSNNNTLPQGGHLPLSKLLPYNHPSIQTFISAHSNYDGILATPNNFEIPPIQNYLNIPGANNQSTNTVLISNYDSMISSDKILNNGELLNSQIQNRSFSKEHNLPSKSQKLFKSNDVESPLVSVVIQNPTLST